MTIWKPISLLCKIDYRLNQLKRAHKFIKKVLVFLKKLPLFAKKLLSFKKKPANSPKIPQKSPRFLEEALKIRKNTRDFPTKSSNNKNMKDNEIDPKHLEAVRRRLDYLVAEGVAVVTGQNAAGETLYRLKSDEEIEAELREIENS